MDLESRLLADEIRKLQISVKHRPLHPETKAHRRFLEEHYGKTQELASKYPFLDFKAELFHFSGQKK
jgi:hypothetical protein